MIPHETHTILSVNLARNNGVITMSATNIQKANELEARHNKPCAIVEVGTSNVYTFNVLEAADSQGQRFVVELTPVE